MRRRAHLLATGLAVMTGPAIAQTFNDPGQRLLIEQQRARTIDRLERAEPGQTLTSQPPAAGPQDDVCFQIRRIVVDNGTRLGAEIISEITGSYRKRCLGQQAISALMAELTNAYVERGFITTRVYIPAQNLKIGTLRLTVVEGRIEAFEHVVIDEDGNAAPAPARRTRTLFDARPGDALQLRGLEQGLDQLNRLPSSQAQIDLKPGTEAGGTIVVVKEKQADRLRGRAGLDNYGSAATGDWRKRATIELDDVASLANQTIATFVSSRNTNAVSGSFSQPYGPWTASLSASYSESGAPVSDEAELFNQTGSASARIDRLIYRDAETKLTVNAGVLANVNHRFLNTAFLEPQQRAAARVGATVEKRLAADVYFVDVGLSWGIPGVLDSAPGSLGRRFVKLDGALTWIHSFASGARLLSTLNAQAAEKPLKSTDQISIGGWDTIRGYRDVEFNGELGLAARNDLYLPIPAALAEWRPPLFGALFEAVPDFRPQTQLYVFSDAGLVRNLGLSERHALWGAGAGVQFRARRFDVDLTLATPLLSAFASRAGDLEAFATLSFKLF